jgi:heme-degrading monooxygenase HmoA
MDRRVCLKSVMIAGVAARVAESPAAAPNAALHGDVQLHMDLDVDPAHDQEFLSNFHATFAPMIRKHPGLQEIRLMKLQTVTTGTRPAGAYRIVLGFQSEKLWRDWVASSDHQRRAWPALERTLGPHGVTAILYTLI